MTIKQSTELYNSVLSGQKIVLNADNPQTICTLSTDGTNWLVDEKPVSTMKYQRVCLELIKAKYDLAQDFMKYIGQPAPDMNENYHYTFDTLDGMLLLRKEDISTLIFIFMPSNYVTIEQINKGTGNMSFDYFGLDYDEVASHYFISGILSSQSLQIIRENKRSKTQNFYYDMLFEGVRSYSEMLTLGNNQEKPNLQNENKLQKINGCKRDLLYY